MNAFLYLSSPLTYTCKSISQWLLGNPKNNGHNNGITLMYHDDLIMRRNLVRG